VRTEFREFFERVFGVKMRFIRENKIVTGIVIATIVLLTVLALTGGQKAKANWGIDGVHIVLRPFEQAWTATVNGVGGFFAHFQDVKKLEDENAALTQQLAQAEENARDIGNYQSENDELRALLNLKDSLKGEDTIAANVIAKDFSNWYSTFTIDKGTSDGVQINKAVRTTAGLVGYVTEVGTNWATVTTILNNGTSVSGIVARTNEAVICKGDFTLQKSGECQLTYISNDANITSGDVIQTSGLGGIYPKGILMGTVGDVQADKQSGSTSAVLQPAVDFEKVNVVLVEGSSQ